MKKPELEKINKSKELQELPLVLEIFPGQSRDGILALFELSEWKGKNLRTLVQQALGREYVTEEQGILEKIKQQLDGGKLLYEGKEIEKYTKPSKYANEERAESGEKYLYISLRAIKPQEGGI